MVGTVRSVALYRRSKPSWNFAGERRNLEKMCGGEANECTTPKNGKEGKAWSRFWPQELEKEKKRREREREGRERSRREKDRGKPAEAGDEGPQDSAYICARIERTRRFSLRFFKVLFFFSLTEVYTRGRHTRVNFWNLILSRGAFEGRNHSHRSANESLFCDFLDSSVVPKHVILFASH